MKKNYLTKLLGLALFLFGFSNTQAQCDTDAADNIDPSQGSLNWSFPTGGNVFAPFGGFGTNIIANPFENQGNNSCSVMQVTRSGCETWAGIGFDGAVANFPSSWSLANSTEKKVTLKVYAVDAATSVSVQLQFDAHPATTPLVNINQPISQTGQWEELTFDFSGHDEKTFKSFIIYVDPGSACNNEVYYIDDVNLHLDPPSTDDNATLSDLQVGGMSIAGFDANILSYTYLLSPGDPIPTVTATEAINGAMAVVTDASSVPGTTQIVVTAVDQSTTKTYEVNFMLNTPLVAASAPLARDAGNVVSIYANGYTDEALTLNWAADGGATHATVDVSGRNVQKYTSVNYAKLNLGESVDISAMTHVHFDYWTPNATKIGLNITGGGQQVVDNSDIGTWASFDMALTEFSSVTSTDGFDFVAGQVEPHDEILFIDNLFFYKADLPTTPLALSAYCGKVVMDNNGTPGSDVVLTIKNLNATQIEVSASSDTENALNQLLVQLGGNASDAQVIDAGTYTTTLTYNAPAPEVISLQILWGKETVPGLQQLNLSNIPFAASCDIPAALNITTSETTSGDVSCGNLNVSAGQTYTVAPGHTLTVLGDITGDLVIESGASLITYEGQNTGSATINRNTTGGGNYSFVGSPVAGDPSITGSDLGSIVYSYDETVAYGADGLARWMDASATELVPGMGYAQAGAHSVVFSGVPNDGTVTVSGLSHTAPDDNHGEHGWNIVSNPYPAAIAIDRFLSNTTNTSTTNGSIYLWDDHGSNSGIRGDNGDYLTVNSLGAVGGPNGGVFNGYIGSMQGFFVKVAAPNADASVVFTESMRVGGVNTDATFFREGDEKPLSVKLSIETADGLFNEMMVGLTSEATLGLDRSLDASKFISNTDLQFYSLISGEKFAIQGLPLASGISTELGFDLGTAAELTLNVQELNSLEAGMTFFLHDSQTGKVYDLSEVSTFTFSATKGADQNRFTLTYAAAGVLSTELLSDQPIYRFLNSNMNVRFGKQTSVQGYAVYDMAGRVINEAEFNSELNEVNIPVNNAGVTIIRIFTTEGTFTRKFLF